MSTNVDRFTKWADEQRQCLTNIRAGFNLYDLPEPEILEVHQEKVIFAPDAEFRRAAYRLERLGKFKRIGRTASYREQVGHRGVMEIELHKNYIEVDYDIYNVWWNKWYGFIFSAAHLFCEVVTHKTAECINKAFKTNIPHLTCPFRIMRLLIKRGLNVRDVREA